ncbi:MAG: site-2 protease family protein [Chloroflexi bacterium]|nr:site-2 protease family protein [Chloroflexota bacterium]
MTQWYDKLPIRRDQLIWVVLGLVFAVLGIVKLGVVTFLTIIVSLVIGITVHECSHAWMANLLGDPTAKLQGRISLNPLRQLDPAGTAMMAVTLATGVGIGWGRPTPVNPNRLKYGRRLGSALVALAGPASNILVATLAGIWLRFFSMPLWLGQLLLTITLMNSFLAMFNLLPIPPLDGFSILIGLISLIPGEQVWRALNWVEGLARYGWMILIGLLMLSQFTSLNLLSRLIYWPASRLVLLITGYLL